VEFDAFCVLFARKYGVLQSWLRAQLTTKLPKRHLGPNGKHNLLLSNKGSFYAQFEGSSPKGACDHDAALFSQPPSCATERFLTTDFPYQA
jgi:hypothetical protein